MELYLGQMSGTSMDAIDSALLDVTPPTPKIIATHRHAIDPDLHDSLHDFVEGRCRAVEDLWRLDAALGGTFATAALALLDQARIRSARVIAIGCHGQTVYHRPDGEWRCTVQIGDPNLIAERTNITTVADFRRRDLAAGGQGAPLAPLFHRAIFALPDSPRAVVNIGGIANLSVLPARADDPLIGFDSGPGNTLLDAWTRRHLGQAMDRDGRWAAQGQVDRALLATLLADPYFRAPPPKSTGREYFHLQWLDARLAALAHGPRPVDVQRTLCELSAATIADAIDAAASAAESVVLCGGGVHNPVLAGALAARLPTREVISSAACGIDPDWIEAGAFAWLASRTLAGLTGNSPDVTGATHPVVLGAIYLAGSKRGRDSDPE